MHTTRNEIQHLKILVEKQINHSYLKKYIQKPVIDEQKILFLHTILSNASIPSHKKERYLITTMLVQIALDTHELVPERIDVEEGTTEMIQGQLNVLAGDYYSGLYYFLLSELDDVEMIQILATAIKKINELKMINYYLDTGSLTEYLNNRKRIESLLITEVAEYVHETSLNRFAEEWIITNVLYCEINKLTNGTTKILGKFIQHIDDDQLLSEKVDNIKRMIEEIPDQYNVIKDCVMEKITEEFTNTTWEND
ncbi:heptaprenyl diphosphate synthase component 1 [Ornithinibacillus caprae]|uniref:heptaprenyl diphosphate synthase component 1 n=1 Tax=Ornithinibacillus caprae TaxID=2678566 RepID=UPI0018C65A41|nr:heptaprenyl diphosphate synthase component 1 [Ornithinibacillus caprae]